MFHLGHGAQFLFVFSLRLFFLCGKCRNCNMKQQPTRNAFKVVCMASRIITVVFQGMKSAAHTLVEYPVLLFDLWDESNIESKTEFE